MSWDFKKEVKRKAIHLPSVSFILIYLLFFGFFDEKVALLVLLAVLIIGIEFEYLRVEAKYKIPIISRLWKYKRKKEQNRLGGEIFFLLGAIICLAVFDYRIAIAAILMTTFGDMAAAIIGKRFGRHWLPWFKKRAWEGIAAEFAVNIVIGYALMKVLLVPSPLAIALAMAATATIVETVVHKLDDNLLIPIFAGFNGQLMLMIIASLP